MPKEITSYADMMGAYTPERARAFEKALLQADFDNQPLERKRETVARVIACLEEEARRGQKQHSHLWKIAEKVYGIDPNRIAQRVLKKAA